MMFPVNRSGATGLKAILLFRSIMHRSHSGYYPIDDWENQLDRIEEVVKKYQKPFIFSEAVIAEEYSRCAKNR